MKRYPIRFSALALGFFWVLPAATYAAPGTPAQQPLWLSDAVKHNILFGIDSSGSMDFEMLVNANDGTIWFGDEGIIADDSGSPNTNTAPGTKKFPYLFPNGGATVGSSGQPYTGKKWLNVANDGHHAVPPIKNYAFTRSPVYNTGYYDPNVTYKPWPSYGGHTFTNASTTATPFEPYSGFTGGGTINLFTNLDTSTKGTDWGFTILNANMVCDESGTKACSAGAYPLEKHYTYYPATYYLVKSTGTYSYTVPASNVLADVGNSVMIEAEDATYAAPFDVNTVLAAGTLATHDTGNLTVAQTSASDSSYVGTLDSTADSTASPSATQGTLSFSFRMPVTSATTAYIWLRVFAADASHNSFWVNLNGYTSATVSGTSATWSSSWNSMEISSTGKQWRWVRWGSASMDGSTQTLNVKVREGGAYVDQVLVTTSSDTPAGVERLADQSTTRSCEQPDPAYYRDFVEHPNSFSGVDAIAPDGKCLQKYTITGTDGDTFTNGGSVGRTVAEEKQNFANWFSYSRRRHQAMRGGLAHALNGVSGINIGEYWIHGLSSDVVMRDIDTYVSLNTFLTGHYGTVPLAGGTPLRSALKFAGDQFMRTNTGAPITESCQKNFTLLFTDGFNTETTVAGIGNEDAAAGAPYQDTYSATLADVAYEYYERSTTPLRSDITPAGNVSVPEACSDADHDESLDCETNLHMNTYTVGLGAKGTFFGRTYNTVADAYANPPIWPDVSTSGTAQQVDDLYHAAVNGRGEAYAADSPDELIEDLSGAITDIVASSGSGSGVTFNTSSLKSSGGNNVFSSVYDSHNWNGDLQATELDSKTGAVSSTVNWSAAELLDDRKLSSDPRTILTFNGTDGVAFQYGSLTSTQKDDLKMSSSGVAETDTEGTKRLNYLRGNRSDEGTYRVRDSILGDFINSKPLYVGKPQSNWPNTAPFGVDGNFHASEFKSDTLAEGGASDRTPVVYVGGNDGMLHGFDASTGSTQGREVLAYVPGFVYSAASTQGLHYLTDPDYEHRYYVDLDPAMQDIYADTGSGTKDWRTILVGGGGAGGKGIFALDVTNPANFSETSTAPANTVMWEFDSGDDSADMGYVMDTPLIAMMENDKWAVIFGNGYESTDGVAKLMILFIEQGLDGTWTYGTDYYKISTGVGSAADRNGLSAITGVDIDKDSKVDRVYAGDLKGNMWVFDLSDSTTANWVVAHSSTVTVKGVKTTTYHPLFVAKDAAGTVQPITKAPSVAINQATPKGTAPNVMVVFGSGQYLVSGDTSNTQEQSIYAVWDNGSHSLLRADLEERTLSEASDMISSTGDAIDWTTQEGWYADLVSLVDGERIQQRPLFRYDEDMGIVAVFSTMLPSDDPCEQGGASAMFCLPIQTGLDVSRPLCDLNGDGDVDDDDEGVGRRFDFLISELNILGNNIYFNETINSEAKEEDELSATTHSVSWDLHGGSEGRIGRLGWHELVEE